MSYKKDRNGATSLILCTQSTDAAPWLPVRRMVYEFESGRANRERENKIKCAGEPRGLVGERGLNKDGCEADIDILEKKKGVDRCCTELELKMNE